MEVKKNMDSLDITTGNTFPVGCGSSFNKEQVNKEKDCVEPRKQVKIESLDAVAGNTLIPVVCKDGKIVNIKEQAIYNCNYFTIMYKDCIEKRREVKITFADKYAPDARVMQHVVDYLEHYMNMPNKEHKEIPEPLPTNDLKDCVPEWDYKFVTSIHNDIEELLADERGGSLLLYLEIPPLFDLCAAYAAYVWRLGDKEACDLFHVEYQTFTPEETERLKAQNVAEFRAVDLTINDD